MYPPAEHSFASCINNCIGAHMATWNSCVINLCEEVKRIERLQKVRKVCSNCTTNLWFDFFWDHVDYWKNVL